MAGDKTPITEQSNDLTLDLDISEPLGMVRLLRQADAQLFAGFKTHPSLIDEETVQTCVRISRVAAEAIKAGKSGAILIAGAGTSGRLAAVVARQFNRMLRNAHQPEVFKPLVAGGVLALVKAEEGAEDNPQLGADDIEAAIATDATSVLYVGISCGMSAPYVAGQLEKLDGNPAATSVLMAFNSIESARDTVIEGWDRSVADVLRSLEESERFILLNPIYGPEAIMGSTRLKGGTATKILLETIFFTALEIAGAIPSDSSSKPIDPKDDASVARRISQLMRRYREVVGATYEHLTVLADMIRLGGATLRCGGKISYLGRDTAGIIGLIDASECPPTFGSSFEDIRGYLRGGWGDLLDEHSDYSRHGVEYQIDHETFENAKLPDLAKGDLVMGIAIGELGPNTRALLEAAKKTKATRGVLLVTAVPPAKGDLPEDLDFAHVIVIPTLGFVPGFLNLAELSLKIALNTLSTGAHIMVGKVYQNRMIDLKISNTKLYSRAVRTIQLLAGVDKVIAEQALHRAVYRKDTLTAEESEASPKSIIQVAASGRRIVPTALLLAQGRMTYEQACELLGRDPVPRRVIKTVLDKQTAAE